MLCTIQYSLLIKLPTLFFLEVKFSAFDMESRPNHLFSKNSDGTAEEKREQSQGSTNEVQKKQCLSQSCVPLIMDVRVHPLVFQYFLDASLGFLTSIGVLDALINQVSRSLAPFKASYSLSLFKAKD